MLKAFLRISYHHCESRGLPGERYGLDCLFYEEEKLLDVNDFISFIGRIGNKAKKLSLNTQCKLSL